MVNRRVWLLALPIAIAAAACGGEPAAPGPAAERAGAAEKAETSRSGGSFSLAGTMTDARQDHDALLLPEGRVMAVGGLGKGSVGWGSPRLETVTIYDPASQTFTPTGSMIKGRQYPRAHLLEDGRVYVAGGREQLKYYKTTELWDPATGEWTEGPRMATDRFQHASLTLRDGRILLTGGQNKLFALVPEAEVFDPVTGELSPAGSMSLGRSAHSATMLQDGRVLVAGGGKGGEGTQEETFDTADIYDPETGEWSAAGTMSAGHADHTATLLNDGRVLIAGGRGKVDAVDIFDPATGSWTAGTSFAEWRAQHTATLLADGRVLVTGGVGRGTSTELYDPGTGTWTRGPDMAEPRYAHTATVLNDGTIFLLGGQSIDATGSRREVSNQGEVYRP